MSKNGNAGAQGAVLACLTLLWCAGPVWSADQQTNFFVPEPFVHQEVKQQQIRSATQRVGEQLASIVSEFERNGIGGEDVKVLRAIRGVLGKLTEKDMEKVVQLLQQSRHTQDPTASNKNATEAYAGQKMIITQLNQLVLEYQRQQAE